MRLMSILISNLFVLFMSTVHADQNEVLVGALTQHFTNFDGVSSKFDNKVSADGTLIANPMAAWRIITYEGLMYASSTFFAGQNSIGELMGGTGASAGIQADKLRLGVAIGGYLQDDQKFRDRGVTPFSLPTGSRVGIAPLFGVELSIDVPIEKSVYATVYTLITPVLSTTTIGIGWNL